MQTVLVTGAAGYVGAMLVSKFSKRDDVSKIIAIDKAKRPESLESSKIIWVEDDFGGSKWQEISAKESPTIIVHTAWQIREMYGKKREQWKLNVEGSLNVFRFAFETPSVARLVYFSSAAVYGASSNNSLNHYFKEEEPMRAFGYLYGIEKREVEDKLQEMRKGEPEGPKIYVVRPAAITGPRGRSMEHRFGLQSSLSGKLKGSFIYSIIRAWVFRVPATKGWVRQFVHEDDVVDIVEKLAFEYSGPSYDVFNLAPPGNPVYPKDMAEAVGKKVLWIYPWMVRLAFFFVWHLTRGIVPTSKGSWRYYSYPVLMDGSKVEDKLNHHYKMGSKEAFTTSIGRYGN